MHPTLVPILIAVVAAAPAVAQSSPQTEADRKGVIAAALDYMEGAANADADRVSRGVHEQLNKVSVRRSPQDDRQFLGYGTYTTLVEVVRGLEEQMKDIDKKAEVTVFDIGHDIAAARAVGQLWYDFLQLARIEGQWRIVNVLWAENRMNAEDQSNIKPGPNDRAAINATALDYIDGSYSGDAARMEHALHPELNKILLTNHRETGKRFLYKMGASNLIEGTRAGLGTLAADKRNIEVEIYDISHDIAAVKVVSAMYIDHLQVAKVNGAWKIINVLWVRNPDAPKAPE
jgi:hypothetical protein